MTLVPELLIPGWPPPVALHLRKVLSQKGNYRGYVAEKEDEDATGDLVFDFDQGF